MNMTVAHFCLQGSSSAPQPPTPPTLKTFTQRNLHLHTADDLLSEGFRQTSQSVVLRLWGVSVYSSSLTKEKKTSLKPKHGSLPGCFHMLMKKIAGPSMCPPPLLHLHLLPLLCSHVGGHWNNWKEDWEQQLPGEEKPAQISGGSTKNKLVGGDLTGAGKTYKHESRKCRAPLNKDQLFRTLQDI